MNLQEASELAVRLWTKFDTVEPRTYSPSEIEFARELSISSVPFYQFVGRVVLFDSDSPDLQKLIEFIKGECAKGFDKAEAYAVNVLWLQFGFPVEALLRDPVRSFIFAAARNKNRSCRGNATHLLLKMARVDAESMSVLQEMKGDSDESVRQNATIFLSQLAE